MVDDDRAELADRGTIRGAFAARLFASLTSPANPLSLEFDVTESPSVVENELNAAEDVPPTPPPPRERFVLKRFAELCVER